MLFLVKSFDMTKVRYVFANPDVKSSALAPMPHGQANSLQGGWVAI